MKKLLSVLMLSLIMMACNKDEDSTMFDWDKIVAEMETTELSAMDVLKSLRDNEYWGENIVYYYFEKDGKIIESLKLGNGLEGEGGGTTIYRFADNVVNIYSNGGPNLKDVWSLSIKDNNGFYSCYYNEKLYFEYKVVAYDENQVLLEMNYSEEYRFTTEEGKFLSEKVLLKRQTSDSKWWEKVVPSVQE
ncbi:MAG: hypothetical protein IKY82_06705 [Alistipes sp.]|nr:hypothetical protein [Alistipes sp.]